MDSIVAYRSDDDQDSDNDDKSRGSTPAYKVETESNNKKFSKNLYDKNRNSPSARRKDSKDDSYKRSTTDRSHETRSKDNNSSSSNKRDDRDRPYDNKRYDDREKVSGEQRRHDERDRNDRRGGGVGGDRGGDDRRHEKDDRRHEDRQRGDDRRKDRHHYRSSREHRNRNDRERRHWRSRSKSKERRVGSNSPPPDKREKDHHRRRHRQSADRESAAPPPSSNRSSSSQYDPSGYTSNKPPSRDYDRLPDSYGTGSDYRGDHHQFNAAPAKDTSSSSYQQSSAIMASFTVSAANNAAAVAAAAAAAAASAAAAAAGFNSEPPKFETAPNKLLPSYYNPNIINPNRYAEQVQKRKLLWGNKKSEDTAKKWGSAKFAQDTDGKVASKFMRLMGIKDAPTAGAVAAATPSAVAAPESIQKQEEMFSSMEQQYEVARQATHTMRGVGLGFSSQSRPF